MYKHIFGPVPSRRLGISLGIDLVNPKSCNMNCIFCECGPTDKLTNLRKRFKSIEEIKKEIVEAIKSIKPDYITFSGSGEPTLSKDLGEIINFIKNNTNLKVAVITNSYLLNDDEVISEIQNADLIIPTINTTKNEIFQKISRPDKYMKIENILKGLIKLSKSKYRGKIFLETFIVEKLNDDEESLKDLSKFIKKLRYDKLQLNSLARAGATNFIKGVSFEKLQKIKSFLVENGLHDVEVIKKLEEKDNKIDIKVIDEDLIKNMEKKRKYSYEELNKIYFKK